MRKTRKALALFLALLMCLCMVPETAFAYNQEYTLTIEYNSNDIELDGNGSMVNPIAVETRPGNVKVLRQAFTVYEGINNPDDNENTCLAKFKAKGDKFFPENYQFYINDSHCNEYGHVTVELTSQAITIKGYPHANMTIEIVDSLPDKPREAKPTGINAVLGDTSVTVTGISNQMEYWVTNTGGNSVYTSFEENATCKAFYFPDNGQGGYADFEIYIRMKGTGTTKPSEDYILGFGVAGVEGIFQMKVNEDGTMTPVPTSVVTEDGKGLVANLEAGNYVAVDNKVEFKDVNDGAWYKEGADFAGSRGLMEGIGNGTFGHNMPVTKAQTQAVIDRLGGADKAESWNNAVAKYGKEEKCDRMTTLSMLHDAYVANKGEAAEKPNRDVIAGFKDAANIPEEYVDTFCWAIEKGIIQGMGDGILNPTGELTRGQFGLLLERTVKALSL